MTKLYEINLEHVKFAILPYQYLFLMSLVLHLVFKCLKSDNAFTHWLKQMETYADHTYQEYLYK